VDDDAGRRRYRRILFGVLLAAAAVRGLYVAAQPAADPTFAAPQLDAAEYVARARAILSGAGGPDGAYYLAPGYAWFVAGVFALAGGSFAALYAVQHLLVLGAAAALAAVARRRGGTVAGVATAVLALTYHPLLFFASRALGETVAVALIAAAIALAANPDRGRGGAGAAGAFAGAAALVRPNFLAVPPIWAVARVRAEPLRAAAMLVGAALAIAPVTVRNATVSGHVVPVAANSGLTLYHGNGPGATGAYTPIQGMSGTIDAQRDEATRLARERSGDPSLDAVEADAWWRRRAIATRLEDPTGTAVLLARRALLTAGGGEIGVDESPRLDEVAWRFGAPVPFAVVFALALAGVAARGVRGTGGAVVWGAVAAAAASPLVFYVSTRYRLPLAALLTVPAGIGVAAIAAEVRARWAGARRASVVAVLALALPIVAPDADLLRASDALALANRGAAWSSAGDLGRAERDLRRAIELDPGAAAPWYNLGVVCERGDRGEAAIEAYARALALDPGHGQAGANLGAMWIRAGRPDLALAPLERAVAARPDLRPGWTNLIVARIAVGDADGARRAAAEAERHGVRVDPALIAAIPASAPDGQ